MYVHTSYQHASSCPDLGIDVSSTTFSLIEIQAYYRNVVIIRILHTEPRYVQRKGQGKVQGQPAHYDRYLCRYDSTRQAGENIHNSNNQNESMIKIEIQL